MTENGRELLGHDGGEEGVTTEAWYDVESGVGFVLLSNGEGRGAYRDALWRIGERVLEEFAPQPQQKHS